MNRPLLFLAAALASAESSQAANLLQNPNFDTDLSGWNYSASGGYIGFEPNDGSPVAGSVAAYAGGSRGGAGISQCVNVEALPLPWEAGLRVRVVYQGSGAFFYSGATFYASPDCSGQDAAFLTFSQGATVPGVQGNFDRYSIILSNDPMPNGLATKSVLVIAHASSFANSITANFDSMYVGPPDTSPVTLTGFDVE